MINNLYKKCSWLSILDIILPGVTLSFLRVHDKQVGSKYGGVYTVFGNISFIVGTIIWVGIEKVFPYSVPFSIITYPFFLGVLFIIAKKRGEFAKLWKGDFNQE